MARISILPEILSNKIAAGEVVERPASVVKELVENALDAKSTRITVEVEKGGRSLIRVSDNGMGMGQDDALLAVERYATSKIRKDSDLFSIATLGFRGEALPSIASVSRFTLVTRERKSDEGASVHIEGGKIKKVAHAGAPPGTMIDVKQLFFNTPARRKFLRTINTEMGHIGDTVSTIALGWPKVQFRLIHNGRVVKNWPRAKDPFDRAVDVLGKEMRKELVAVTHSGNELSISGWTSTPSLTRSTSQKIHLYVNGRYIRDRGLSHALFQGYRGRIMKGRFPVAVLFITLPYDQLDVNVHPTKHEVRFSNQRRVYDALKDSVMAALAAADRPRWAERGEAVQPVPPEESIFRRNTVENPGSPGPGGNASPGNGGKSGAGSRSAFPSAGLAGDAGQLVEGAHRPTGEAGPGGMFGSSRHTAMPAAGPFVTEKEDRGERIPAKAPSVKGSSPGNDAQRDSRSTVSRETPAGERRSEDPSGGEVGVGETTLFRREGETNVSGKAAGDKLPGGSGAALEAPVLEDCAAAEGDAVQDAGMDYPLPGASKMVVREREYRAAGGAGYGEAPEIGTVTAGRNRAGNPSAVFAGKSDQPMGADVAGGHASLEEAVFAAETSPGGNCAPDGEANFTGETGLAGECDSVGETGLAGERGPVEETSFTGETDPAERSPRKEAAEDSEIAGGSEAGEPQSEIWEKRFFSDLTVIGQFRETYILCESREGLILIDQHAAHERVVYEELKKSGAGGKGASQRLLIPETVDLNFKEADLLAGMIPELEKLGLMIEPFGGNTFVIKGVPPQLPQGEVKQLVEEIVEEMQETGFSPGLSEAIDRCIILMACHGAIRARRSLTPAHIKRLLEQLDLCENPSHCPHGRPIWLSWTTGFLEKSFRRIV